MYLSPVEGLAAGLAQLIPHSLHFKFPQCSLLGVIMRSINQILVDIVLANGGTVTNPNNRNQLLRDWLLAIS